MKRLKEVTKNTAVEKNWLRMQLLDRARGADKVTIFLDTYASNYQTKALREKQTKHQK